MHSPPSLSWLDTSSKGVRNNYIREIFNQRDVIICSYISYEKKKDDVNVQKSYDYFNQ